MASTFSADVDEWVRQSEVRMEAVWKESTQRLIELANLRTSKGGRMRVKTGFLSASGDASLTAMPLINPSARPVEGRVYAFDIAPVIVVLAGASLGQTIYYGWTAAYAGHREFGSNGQPPDAFARGAAQRWDKIVAEVVVELKSRSGG